MPDLNRRDARQFKQTLGAYRVDRQTEPEQMIEV